MTNININTQREANDLNHQIHIFNEIAHNIQRFIAWNEIIAGFSKPTKRLTQLTAVTLTWNRVGTSKVKVYELWICEFYVNDAVANDIDNKHENELNYNLMWRIMKAILWI